MLFVVFCVFVSNENLSVYTCFMSTVINPISFTYWVLDMLLCILCWLRPTNEIPYTIASWIKYLCSNDVFLLDESLAIAMSSSTHRSRHWLVRHVDVLSVRWNRQWIYELINPQTLSVKNDYFLHSVQRDSVICHMCTTRLLCFVWSNLHCVLILHLVVTTSRPSVSTYE